MRLGEQGAERQGGPPGDAGVDAPIRIAVIVSFQNEAELLPVLLASIAAQTEPADQLVLVDDGSTDASPELVAAFRVSHPETTIVRRERRPPERDRLADAPELRAFQSGVEALAEPWDVVAKLDGDLSLSPTLFADVRAQFRSDSNLGITGGYLSVRTDGGGQIRETHPEHHVRGPNKFYRRRCFEQISPLPAQLGWDTLDDLRARAAGWRTRSFGPTAGDSIHLRQTGSHDGRLRAYRRWGVCAWAYGAHPLAVVLGAVQRGTRPPYVLGGASYLWGWCGAGLRGYPRAEPQTRAFARREDLTRIGTLLRRAMRVST